MSNPFTILALTLALALPLSAATGSSHRAPARPVNLNTASVTELMQLPRVGAKTAERIVAVGVGSKISCESPYTLANLHNHSRLSRNRREYGPPNRTDSMEGAFYTFPPYPGVRGLVPLTPVSRPSAQSSDGIQHALNRMESRLLP